MPNKQLNDSEKNTDPFVEITFDKSEPNVIKEKLVNSDPNTTSMYGAEEEEDLTQSIVIEEEMLKQQFNKHVLLMVSTQLGMK